MAEFTRETFEKKNLITQDNISIVAPVSSGQTIVAGDVVAYNAGAGEWVKFVPGTHDTGLFALAVAKEDVVTSTAAKKIAVLKAGIVNSKEVTIANTLKNLLMLNGIVVA